MSWINVFKKYPVETWKRLVANNETRLGYENWVYNQIEKANQEVDDGQKEATP